MATASSKQSYIATINAMRTIIHAPDSRTTINWTSGTSTEIFIYPADGSFAARNFLFRISTATVEAESSTFTFFEGITRHLMILKGELELVHEGHYTKHLRPYDQDVFSGEWSTRSKGKVTDFNLMLKGGATGSLRHRAVEGGTETFLMDADFQAIYIASGSMQSPEGLTIGTGDLIQMSKEQSLQLSGTADLIEIRVMVP